MDNQTFQQLANHVETDLINGRLHDALTLLSNILSAEKTAAGLRREALNIQADYERLLHYMAEGTEDKSRASLHRRFIQRAFRLLQNLRRSHVIANEQNLYALVARATNEEWKPLFEETIARLDKENDFELQDSLFELIWTAPQLNQYEERQLRLLLIATEPNVRCYMLSALSLALLHFFDASKLRLLMEYAQVEPAAEHVRAIIGIAITTQLHGERLSIYPRLRHALLQLAANGQFTEGLTVLQHHFCLYQEAEQLQKKMEEEILPALIKAGQERARLGFDPEEEEELDAPDSKLNLSKEMRRRISNSAKEMFRMFQEGIDINLHTFAALKAFPFFHRIGHWLAPFDERRPEITTPAVIQKMHAGLCDSDRYSVSLLTHHIPKERQADLGKMIQEHAEDIEQKTAEAVPMGDYQNVIQCLYRLLRCSPWQSMWPTVFSGDSLLINNSVLGPLLHRTPDFLLRTGNTLFRHNRYKQAEQHFSLYRKQADTDFTLLGQLGYCKERQGQFQQAIRYFQEANMLAPDDRQILFHLQHCHARLGHYEEQLEFLLQLEKHSPNDSRILTETGMCLIQLQRWKEAQQRFYKMEFSGQRVVPSMRGIAWCALRMGDYDTADRYYTRILEENVTEARWEDFLNKGHICWLKGNTTEALSFYHEYARRYATGNPQATDALAPYDEDAHVLQERGKSSSDIALMHDLIERSL